MQCNSSSRTATPSSRKISLTGQTSFKHTYSPHTIVYTYSLTNERMPIFALDHNFFSFSDYEGRHESTDTTQPALPLLPTSHHCPSGTNWERTPPTSHPHLIFLSLFRRCPRVRLLSFYGTVGDLMISLTALRFWNFHVWLCSKELGSRRGKRRSHLSKFPRLLFFLECVKFLRVLLSKPWCVCVFG